MQNKTEYKWAGHSPQLWIMLFTSLLLGITALITLSLYFLGIRDIPAKLSDPGAVETPGLVPLPVQVVPGPVAIKVWERDAQPLIRNIAKDAVDHGGWINDASVEDWKLSIVVPEGYLPRLDPLMNSQVDSNVHPHYRAWVQGERPTATATGAMTRVDFEIQTHEPILGRPSLLFWSIVTLCVLGISQIIAVAGWLAVLAMRRRAGDPTQYQEPTTDP